MLKTGPWGRCHHPEATHPGGGTERQVGCARKVTRQITLVVRVESSTGDEPSDPNAGPFLSWVVCVRSISHLQTGRAGFLKSARPTHQSTTKHKYSSILIKGHFQPTLLPRLAPQVKGTRPDERQHAATWWRGAGQQGAVPLAPRPHTCTPFLHGSEHVTDLTHDPGGRSGGRRARPRGARTPVCSKMLSVLRSGWKDHSFESGQTDFSEMCPSSFVFTLKEPRARSVMNPKFANNGVDRRVSNGKDIRPNS